MLQYTYATLRGHLTTWIEGNGDDADTNFVSALDEIIQRGEARLYRDLDIATLDTLATTATEASTAEVDKPEDLISEEVVILSGSPNSQLQKRSRAFIAAMNLTGATGAPRYYAELSAEQWTLAPIPVGTSTLTVHGMYLLPSITDEQDDDAVTWVSTRIGDVLAHACEIEAASMLKFWTLKEAKEKDYLGKLDDARAITENQRKTNVGDIMGLRAKARQATGPDPAGTP